LVALRHPIDECSCLDAVKVLVENQKTSDEYLHPCPSLRHPKADPTMEACVTAVCVISTRTYSAYDWGVI